MGKIKEAKDFINLGIVLNGKGEVLMIRRVKEEKGKEDAVLTWAFPGGKQRFDETREKCVEKEILEETGYDVRSIKQISLRVHPQFLVMIVYHLCKLNSPKPVAKPREPHEVAEIRWVKPKEIKNLITTDLDPNVAKELGINKVTGYIWLKEWNENGLDGLKPKYRSGRPPKLSKEQKDELKSILKNRDDWTTKEVRELIKERFGIEYSLRHVSRILKSLGMKYGKPYQHDYRKPKNAKDEFKKT
mgnify:CR=1 FL=1